MICQWLFPFLVTLALFFQFELAHTDCITNQALHCFLLAQLFVPSSCLGILCCVILWYHFEIQYISAVHCHWIQLNCTISKYRIWPHGKWTIFHFTAVVYLVSCRSLLSVIACFIKLCDLSIFLMTLNIWWLMRPLSKKVSSLEKKDSTFSNAQLFYCQQGQGCLLFH